MLVKIVDVPPGEAPEWVRREWVGLVLPVLAGAEGPQRLTSYGVLSGPRTMLGRLWQRLTGRAITRPQFLVAVVDAIDVLGASSPDAADWWWDNAQHMLDECFGFDADVCEVVE
jgi:hypothetical protein